MPHENKKVKIKKVSPYPIEVSLKGEEPASINGKILKVTSLGFFADLAGKIFHLNTIYEVSFELPGIKRHILTKCKVIKYIDRSVPAEGSAKATKVERLCEFHFLALSDEHNKRIEDFCRLIRQVNS